MTADTAHGNDQLTEQMEQRSRSFDAWASEYERYRPGYPDALFEHIAQRLGLPEQAQVADLGAGTGKAARAMARRGWRVTAVEPGGPMLDELRVQAAREGLVLETRVGSAEATGLADGSVDLATAAQSFHWFDKEAAVPEMARIVRPGGGAAVFWNSRADDRSAFLAAYTELLARYVPEEHLDRQRPTEIFDTRGQLAAGGRFDVDDSVQLHHVVEMPVADFIGLAFTASYVHMFATGAAAQALRADLQALLAEHARHGFISVPYDLDVYVARRNSVR
jgi:ubiquinone/menaquinone biosynthesis C-methylase UbiE